VSEDITDTPEFKAALEEQLAGLKAKNTEVFDKFKAAEKALRQYEGIDPDKYSELIKAHEQAEIERAKAEGDIEAIQKKAEKDREKLQAVIADLKRKNENTHREAAALAAIAKHDGNVTLLKGIVSGALEVVEDGDNYSVVASYQGEKLSPDQYVAKLKADDEYAGAFSGTGVGGQGSKPATDRTPAGLEKLVPDGVEYLT